MTKGNISVQTENIFPIIKQFLYSDQEIFLRELISNAVDATTKLNTMASKGEVKGEVGDTTIEIILDKDAKTLTIRDKGIGMDSEEAMKYLNQVAFSSAQEFLDKYKGESNIIGHFGLGFYSAFMVSSKVEVVTKSWKENAEPVKWSCDGNPEYTLEPVQKENRGTDVILHINDDALEYLENDKIQSLLDKYCKFLPVLIQFGTKTETDYIGEGEDMKTEEKVVDNIINNPKPLWKKLPTEMTDEDYVAFYQELYPFSPAPLFWIHLNIDYPFNLTGILYFPHMNNSMEVQKNKIQLYSNQVYVTDDVKEIVPEFLTLLHGVIDSPDIPLNVSRSYLQSDKEVKKITGYITKKVADKLNELFKNKREEFESKWNDIGIFVKYGMLTDDAFYDKAINFALLHNTENQFFTIEEYKEKISVNQTDKNGKIVHVYTNNVKAHDSFITSAKNKGYDVLLFDQMIDNHLIQKLEHKLVNTSFVRVDADTVNNLIKKDEHIESVLSETEQSTVKEIFTKALDDNKGNITLTPLSPDDQPVTVVRPEFMRRMKDMQQFQGMQMGDFGDFYNIVINTNHPLICTKLIGASDVDRDNMAKYLCDLALLNQGMLEGPALTAFVQKSISMMN
ncbi:MAG: molecular chaperone HtpG [Saprospiraceae bacterium]